jgi:choline dehydrogenase-like flavoprotein
MADPQEFRHREWDVVVIGTGMGGATLGYALAKAGRKILFCERGRSHLGDGPALRGDFAETFFDRPEAPQPKHADVLLRAGRYAEEVTDRSTTRVTRYVPVIGCGTGGSSALYGGALERFFPADFAPKRYHRAASETTLPESWPISYEDLRPYYEAAESLFRVHGTPDPCRADDRTSPLLPPPPLAAKNQELHDFFRAKGLHPYHLPLACYTVADCRVCQGFLCPRDCKGDSARTCLRPALEAHGAELLDDCEVRRLEATRTAVTKVVCRRRGEDLALRAGVVVLAAGALETPRLLFNSASPAWPNGLANDSGLVGRNLMRHYIDLYAVACRSAGQAGENLKELAFNDLYVTDGEKYGTFQSFGALPPMPVLLAGMEHDLRNSRMAMVAPFFKLARPALRLALGRVLAGRVILASILEDLPYADNRVTLPDFGHGGGRDRLALSYRIREYDRARIRAFRERLGEVLRPYRFLLIKQAENNERLAHACGTCRFGADPRESVLDPWNRAHGLANLYVVDSSFFPSGGGTNPGLTIAANALRVADHLLQGEPRRPGRSTVGGVTA